MGLRRRDVALDVIADRPLGSSSFALLIAVGGSAALAGALGQFRIISPIIATAIFSPVYALTFTALYTALRPPVPSWTRSVR